MASTTAAAPTAGVWFGELSAALQGKWEAMLSQQQQQQVVGAAVQAKKKAAAAATSGAAAGAGKPREEEGKIGGCGGAMSDTTVYLLLDRFAPS